MQTFEIFYPETATYGRVTVEVRPGEAPEQAIIREGDAVHAWVLIGEAEVPIWTKTCECGATVERYRGQGDVTCNGPGKHCYNAGGQRLRDDWRGNPSTWDDDISDLEGYEIQHADW